MSLSLFGEIIKIIIFFLFLFLVYEAGTVHGADHGITLEGNMVNYDAKR